MKALDNRLLEAEKIILNDLNIEDTVNKKEHVKTFDVAKEVKRDFIIAFELEREKLSELGGKREEGFVREMLKCLQTTRVANDDLFYCDRVIKRKDRSNNVNNEWNFFQAKRNIKSENVKIDIQKKINNEIQNVLTETEKRIKTIEPEEVKTLNLPSSKTQF